MKHDPAKCERRAASRLASFRYAFAGWWYVLRTQRNAWIHAVVAVAVVAVALWLDLGCRDWAILFLTIALVWVAEFVNTAVEAVVDLLSPDIHPRAKIAKDVAAAAVLIAALAAGAVGLLILGPPLWARLNPAHPPLGSASLSCLPRNAAETCSLMLPPSTDRVAPALEMRTGRLHSVSVKRVDSERAEAYYHGLLIFNTYWISPLKRLHVSR